MSFGSAANKVWIASLAVGLLVILLASGMPPIPVILITAGFLVFVIGSNLAFDRSRAARGRPGTTAATLEDFVNMKPRDWLLALASAALGGGLAIAGMFLVSSGAGR